MKILVCVKASRGEINPFDESALECALTLSQDVTVIAMCPRSAEQVLRPLTRLGAKVVMISDPLYAGSDTLATSYILSTAIKKLDFDLIICGRQSVDGDTAQVGPMLSQMLGLPLMTGVMKAQSCDSGLKCTTREGDLTLSLPALITLERSYILRFPSIFSKMGDTEILDNSHICCDPSRCGLSGSPTRVVETFENQRGRRNCKFISDSELYPLINDLMNREPLAKKDDSDSSHKFKNVWAVGDEVLEKAYEISEKVTLLEKLSPEEIAEKALLEKPEVILWNADAWGRRNAPITAARLKTGLCADCTQLQTDGETLFMYRPALSGSVTAKIKCMTYPQMATVRTKSLSSDIIVSGGRGVSDKIDKLKAFASSLNAELGASRALVDMGKLPYENQIGLTGKNVSPKIYIAIGISGAIHHTCAIENADYVIAINPDKNAKIFEYSDYGILSEFNF